MAKENKDKLECFICKNKYSEEKGEYFDIQEVEFWTCKICLDDVIEHLIDQGYVLLRED
jgi:hypothetical protein